jgi:transcriptional regulator with XRE-family HTH domain
MARPTTSSLQTRFGQRIRRLREARGWSFTYLAIHSGVAKSTLLELEKGRTEARLNTIAALAGSFDKSISELFKGL